MTELYKYRKGEKVVDRYKRIYGMTDEEAEEALRKKQEKARIGWLRSRGLLPREESGEAEVESRQKRARMRQKQRLERSLGMFMGLSRLEFQAVEGMARKMRKTLKEFRDPQYLPPRALRRMQAEEERRNRKLNRESSITTYVHRDFTESGVTEKMPLREAREKYPHLFEADRMKDGMERLRRLRIEREKEKVNGDVDAG